MTKNPIDQDDKLAKAVGRLAGHWGLLESAVELLFLVLCDAPGRKGVILFSYYKNVDTQCDVVQYMANETDLSPKARISIKKALKTYRGLAPERTLYIHYPFGYDSTANMALYKMKRVKTGESLYLRDPVSPTVIDGVTKKVLRATRRAQIALNRVEKTLQQRLLPQPPRPSLESLSALLQRSRELPEGQPLPPEPSQASESEE